ncbi:MAG: YceI family protein [Thermoleophilaceae bacterium]
MSTTATHVGTWNIDPSHSSVNFSVKHLGIATVRGTFNEFEGTLELGEDLASSKAHGTVQVASVDTKEDARDEHLRSADFFDAESHEKLSFVSTEIKPLDDDELEIHGDLTIHGVTNPVQFKAEITGTEEDPWGNDRVGLEVNGKINRGDFGMKFNQALGSGNVMVSDTVKISLDISAVKAA